VSLAFYSLRDDFGRVVDLIGAARSMKKGTIASP
jgi:hypothetical protein